MNDTRLLTGVDRTVTVPGKALLSLTTSAGSSVIGAQLSVAGSLISSRLKALGDVYKEFRFTRIVFKIHPVVNSAGTPVPYTLSYYKNIPLTAPTTMADGYQATSSRLVAGTDTVPQLMTLDSSVLLNNIRPWYDCDTATSSDANDYSQGILYLTTPAIATTTISPLIEMAYVVQFRGATTPTVD